MSDNGITSGCGNGNYCPKDNVTREQMAAFMQRLATKKVVDAATAVSADSATTAGHATTADSATTATSATTADSATAADNANLLDGMDSTAFMPSGDIVTSHYGNLADISGAPIGGIYALANMTDETGIHPLVAPTMIGSAEYGMKSIEVCVSGTGSITTLGSLHLAAPDVFGAVVDETISFSPTSSFDCVSLDVGFGGAGYANSMAIEVTGNLVVLATHVTWSTDSVGTPPSLLSTGSGLESVLSELIGQ